VVSTVGVGKVAIGGIGHVPSMARR
jgi:hypothetical protein